MIKTNNTIHTPKGGKPIPESSLVEREQISNHQLINMSAVVTTWLYLGVVRIEWKAIVENYRVVAIVGLVPLNSVMIRVFLRNSVIFRKSTSLNDLVISAEIWSEEPVNDSKILEVSVSFAGPTRDSENDSTKDLVASRRSSFSIV